MSHSSFGSGHYLIYSIANPNQLMENIFKSSFQIYLFLIMKQTVLKLKCMLTLTFILICIFLIESERLNYTPSAYLKLKQREILRKDVDVFILFFFGGVWFFSCCLFVFLTFMTARQLTTPSHLSSSKPLRCFFFFLKCNVHLLFFCFRGRIPEVS